MSPSLHPTKGMSVQIHIPASIEEATQALTGIDQLLTAKGWERAAIVYAFVLPGTGGRRTARGVVQLSIREFAELGISGLSTQDSVRRYRSAWMEHGDPDIKPGDTIFLPDVPFPSHPKPGNEYGYRTDEGLASTIERAVEHHGAAKVQVTLDEVRDTGEDTAIEPTKQVDRTERDLLQLGINMLENLRILRRLADKDLADHQRVQLEAAKDRGQQVIDAITLLLAGSDVADMVEAYLRDGDFA